MLRGITRSTSTSSDKYDEKCPSTNVSGNDYELVVASNGGFTFRLAVSFAACVIGASFQVGFNLGVMNTPQTVIEEFINTSFTNQTGETLTTDLGTWLWSITVAIFCIGGMIGGVSAGYFANRYGRKGGMLRNNLVLLVGIGLAVASIPLNCFELLIVARFIIGINCGMSTGLAPLYLSETAPISVRGLAGVLNQLAIVTGVLISQALGKPLGGETGKLMYLFGASAVPAVLQLIVLPFCPESPQHLLINNNKEHEARQALVTLRNTMAVEDELEDINQEKRALEGIAKVTILDLFRFSALRQPLIIAVVLQCSQQFSGINAIIYYSTQIFKKAGLNEDNAYYGTLGTSGVNVVMTFVSALIMDRAGRRTLHLIGLIGMLLAGGAFTLFESLSTGKVSNQTMTMLTAADASVDNSAAIYSWLSIACIMLFVVAFGTGPGSIPWFITAELFEAGPRPAALSVSVLVNWFANFLVGFIFPFLQKTLETYVLTPFLGLLLLFIIYTFIKVPETKNRTIEEISRQFKDNNGYYPLPE